MELDPRHFVEGEAGTEEFCEGWGGGEEEDRSGPGSGFLGFFFLSGSGRDGRDGRDKRDGRDGGS